MSNNIVKQWFPQLPLALERTPMAGLLCAAALLLGVTLAWTRSAAAPNRDIEPVAANAVNLNAGSQKPLTGNDESGGFDSDAQIQNQAGYFRITGARISFVPAENQHLFVGLENLILERVAQITAASSDQSQWIVSGVITQYRGTNFLLLSQAWLKSQSGSANIAQ